MNSILLEVRLELAKTAYDEQLERREAATERFSSVVTVYSIIGAILAFYLSGFLVDQFEAGFLWFYIPCGIGVVLAFIGFYYLSRNLILGTTFEILNSAKEVDSAINQGVDSAVKSNVNPHDIEVALKHALLAQYVHCASRNLEANNRREHRYTMSLRLSTLSIVFLILSIPGYLYINGVSKSDITKVQIVQPVKIMSQESKNQGNPQAASQTQTSTTQSAPPASSQSVEFKLPDTLRINEARGVKQSGVPLDVPSKKSTN